MSFLLTPGQGQVVKQVGTFTVPTDLHPSVEMIDAFVRDNLAQWAKPWVEIMAQKGWTIKTGISVERDPLPEVGDMYKGTSDTLRYRYNMVAGFEGIIEEKTFHIPDKVAREIADNPRFKITYGD